jgi:RTA1 like protein
VYFSADYHSSGALNIQCDNNGKEYKLSESLCLVVFIKIVEFTICNRPSFPIDSFLVYSQYTSIFSSLSHHHLIIMVNPSPNITIPFANITSRGSGPGSTDYVGNLTLLLNPELCTLDTCDLTLASFMYLPNIPGNAIFAALFALFLVVQLFLGIKHKTWGFMGAFVMGLILETVGYIARILIHNNPFQNNYFLIYLILLTIAPAFLTAG